MKFNIPDVAIIVKWKKTLLTLEWSITTKTKKQTYIHE